VVVPGLALLGVGHGEDLVELVPAARFEVSLRGKMSER
jgi:hypothetical protein